MINGYKGSVDPFIELYYKDNLNEEINKAETQLEEELKENPNHLGTHSRLRARIDALMNLSAYKRWLHNNEIEEKSIEDFGIEVGFSDEYSLCCECYEAVVRTSPDSYCWTPPLFIDCEGYVCDDCAKNYKDYVLEEYSNVQKHVPDQFDMQELGLVKVNDSSYENGLYGGQTDDPKKIIEALNSQNINCWFKVYPNQFDVHFDAYVKEDDLDKAKEVLENLDVYIGYDPAENLKKCLQNCKVGSSEQGIVYNKCDISTGNVETRIISEEDFIERGIK